MSPDSSDSIDQDRRISASGERTCLRNRRVTAACETCRRRKERCNGQQPCQRCLERAVEVDCYFVTRQLKFRKRKVRARPQIRPTSEHETRLLLQKDDPRLDIPWQSSKTEFPLIRVDTEPEIQSGTLANDHSDNLVFAGESASLSFLQTLRTLFSDCVGSCPFVDDPTFYRAIDQIPGGQLESSHGAKQPDRPKITTIEKERLLNRYCLATNCLLDLFDESELRRSLASEDDLHVSYSSMPDSIFSLVLAIGAQVDSDDDDNLATSLFTYGKCAWSNNNISDLSIQVVQSHILISFYSIGAGRHSAAFMFLGIAVRAAHAIGLHRKEVASRSSKHDYQTRERTWKCLRILDLFMSALLGQPPSTLETRETETDLDYSAPTDLCYIGEMILVEMNSSRKMSMDTIERIAAHHSRWASRFTTGLTRDKIMAEDSWQDGIMPNLGLLHLKEAYLWTIIVLTAPLLVDLTKTHLQKAAMEPDRCNAIREDAPEESTKLLIDACVDSALRTIDLLEQLKDCASTPKRLPWIATCVFIAAVAIGFANVSDMYTEYPLARYLEKAQELLAQFAHDRVAQRDAKIVGTLRSACQKHNDRRSERHVQQKRLAVETLFGHVHSSLPVLLNGFSPPTNSISLDPADASAGEEHPLAVETMETHGTVADQSTILGSLDDLDIFEDWASFTAVPLPPMNSLLESYEFAA